MHTNIRRILLVYASIAGTGPLWLAEAQEVVEGGIAALYGTSDQGPRGEEKSDFDILLQKPNATGNFPVSVPSNPSIATASSIPEAWSWSISIVADLPIPSTSESSDEFYTGGKLGFNSPLLAANTSSDSSNLTGDDWSVCLYEWSLGDAAYPAQLRADNGTCSSVLSSQCIAAIEQKAASKHRSGRCTCPIARDIPECADLGDDSALWSSGCGASWYNASMARAWGPEGLELRTYGSRDAHERGNTTAYNYFGSVAWPVMASFSGLGTDGLVMARLSCPRADTATKGSIAPTTEGLRAGDDQGQDGDDGQSDQQNSGGRIKASWMVFGGIFAALMLTI